MNGQQAMRYEQHSKYACNQGFTLLELMIVVAIVAVLASIAYPAYRDYVMKSRRADAKVALTDAAARLEQYYADNKGYPTSNDMALLGYETPDKDGAAYSPDRYYKINFTAAPTTTSYTLQAVPQTQGGQNQDKCKTFTLTNTGVKNVTGGATLAADRCWQ